MLPLLAVLLAVAHPPAAYIDTGARHVPLDVSGWCWGAHCGAPIDASKHTATVRRNSTVRVELAFAPTSAQVAVNGRKTAVARHGSELTWTATRAGGLTIEVRKGRNFVVYVGRLKVRAG
jgi:hypothetical protein